MSLLLVCGFVVVVVIVVCCLLFVGFCVSCPLLLSSVAFDSVADVVVCCCCVLCVVSRLFLQLQLLVSCLLFRCVLIVVGCLHVCLFVVLFVCVVSYVCSRCCLWFVAWCGMIVACLLLVCCYCCWCCLSLLPLLCIGCCLLCFDSRYVFLVGVC